jgi:hypothetical protein
MVGNACAWGNIYGTIVNAIGFTSIPFIMDQSFNVLKNIVLLCFRIWKEVPSNLRM